MVLPSLLGDFSNSTCFLAKGIMKRVFQGSFRKPLALFVFRGEKALLQIPSDPGLALR